MAIRCKICGEKISLFSGNVPDQLVIDNAKKYDIYDDNLCQNCLSLKISKFVNKNNCGQTAVHSIRDIIIKHNDIVKKVFISADRIPEGVKDLGFITGYCILGTGILSELISGVTDFAGAESSVYLAKIKQCEKIALNMLTVEALAHGANCIYSCKVSLVEATRGHGMLMFSAFGSAAYKEGVFTREEEDDVAMIAKGYRDLGFS